MPKLELRKKNPSRVFKKPRKVEVMSNADRVKRTLARLDAKIAEQTAIHTGKFQADRKMTVPYDLNKPEDVMTVTNNACWRPDLFLNGGRACDNCALYQWCRAKCKRLKDEDSQPEDKTADFLKEERRMSRPQVEVLTPSRPSRAERPKRNPFKKQLIVKVAGRIIGLDD